MRDLTTVQFIYDATGELQSAVVPYPLYKELVGSGQAVSPPLYPDPEAPLDYRDLPGDVINYLIDDDCTRILAWRKYRGVDFDTISNFIPIDFTVLTNIEAGNCRPTRKQLSRFAELYNCTTAQLID